MLKRVGHRQAEDPQWKLCKLDKAAARTHARGTSASVLALLPHAVVHSVNAGASSATNAAAPAEASLPSVLDASPSRPASGWPDKTR